MANEASIVIPVELDDKQAQAALNKLNRDIQKTQAAISKSESSHNTIADQLRKAQDEAVATYNRVEELRAALAENEATLNFNVSGQEVDATQYAQALEEHSAISAELKEQEALLSKQEAAAQKLEAQDQAVLEKLQDQTNELHQQQEQAGLLEKQTIDTGSSGLVNIKDSIASGTSAMKKGLGMLLKYGIGIRSLFVLFRRLRSAITDGVKSFAEYDDETKSSINGLKASLSGLKASWGAAFAPILNAVAPILNSLINLLTQAAYAIQRFFAILSGKSTIKKAIVNQDKLTKSVSGTGAAAEEAKKQLAGFDELNILDENSSGGGGGGGADDFLRYEEEFIDSESFGAQLAMSVKDVLFDWSELTPEQIAEKCFAAIPTAIGVVAGGMVGGLPGALIGGLVGLTLGILSDAIIFDHDGVLSTQEILSMVQSALLMMGFGAIGLAVGGPFGMALGAVIGLGLSLAIKVGFDGGDNPVFTFVRKYLSDQAIIGFIRSVLSWDNIKSFFWDNGLKLFVDDVLSLFGLSIDNFGRDIRGKFDDFTNGIKEKLDAFKTWWSNIKLPQFHVVMPHIGVDYIPTDSIIAKFFGITALPHLRVDWYAKGGIVDGATLIGAGEAGKEAIIPLERNTEWISKVANDLADILVGNSFMDRFASAIANVPMPAMASGSVIPPMITVNGIGEDFGANILNRIDALSERIQALADRDFVGYSTIEMDKRKIGEAVTRYQREQERAGR